MGRSGKNECVLCGGWKDVGGLDFLNRIKIFVTNLWHYGWWQVIENLLYALFFSPDKKTYFFIEV